MTRDDWLLDFVDELVKLRPHLVGSNAVHTLALQQYDPKQHPREMARQYDKAVRAQKAPAKRPK